ncbi:MAG: hypothetical protein IRY90_05855 [Actinomadura rubrobrunea]|nr:hypothetical protein [Actinomadura rubrobrunea]
MTTYLHLLCIAVGGAIFPFRLWTLVRRPDVPNAAFCCYVGLSVLSYIVLLPPVYTEIDHAVGVTNSAGMISAVSVLGLIAAQQTLLMHWNFPAAAAKRKIRIRVCLFLFLIALFVAAFFLWPPQKQKLAEFYFYYTRHPLEAPYLAIYLLGCVIGQFDVVRFCRRFARITDRPWIRRGMRITAMGATLILIYCAIRIAEIARSLFGADLSRLEPAAWLCGDIGSALALLGWFVPNLGPWLSSIPRWVKNYRAHSRLYPLWAVLREAVPDVALAPPESRLHDRLKFRNIDFWLHRRVIEIQDAQRILRPEIDTAAELIARDGAAASSASVDRIPLSIARARLAVARQGWTEASEADWDTEVAWLCAVAQALTERRARRRSVVRSIGRRVTCFGRLLMRAVLPGSREKPQPGPDSPVGTSRPEARSKTAR